jgi:hypothetical protein
VKRYKILLASFGVLLLAAATAACTPAATGPTSFEELFSDPARYDGRTVTLEAYFYQGFETIVLSERLDDSGYAVGHLVPKGRMIWVEGGIPRPVYDALQVQSMMGPDERFGKVSVTGVFNFGGDYGHLGRFDHQITPLEVTLLD